MVETERGFCAWRESGDTGEGWIQRRLRLASNEVIRASVPARFAQTVGRASSARLAAVIGCQRQDQHVEISLQLKPFSSIGEKPLNREDIRTAGKRSDLAHSFGSTGEPYMSNPSGQARAGDRSWDERPRGRGCAGEPFRPGDRAGKGPPCRSACASTRHAAIAPAAWAPVGWPRGALPLLARLVEARRRGAVEPRRAVEAAHLDVDGARVGIAAPHEHGGEPLALAAAQVGLDPDFRLEAHRPRV